VGAIRNRRPTFVIELGTPGGLSICGTGVNDVEELKNRIMDHVKHIAGNLEKMPPKSTYIYPKLLSGLLFHSLKGN
jgi:hypothetical protein